ncbi:hypothetical protein Salat_2108700 [Sesamum alatum]|uniref:Uncharacterized protein n=1 Tax=Sesamum alatum TaxID=300844 RepID=A0AAE2CGP2_9LAMI|nr:hypothetical protein Salat_2108700 [Sesamum alatum]
MNTSGYSPPFCCRSVDLFTTGYTPSGGVTSGCKEAPHNSRRSPNRCVTVLLPPPRTEMLKNRQRLSVPLPYHPLRKFTKLREIILPRYLAILLRSRPNVRRRTTINARLANEERE